MQLRIAVVLAKINEGCVVGKPLRNLFKGTIDGVRE
jgi:hypothetical protein